jgi:hypothetical protein
MEMPTLKRPTSSKLMCFASETLLLTVLKLVTLKVGLEHLDSEKWKCRHSDVRHLVS